MRASGVDMRFLGGTVHTIAALAILQSQTKCDVMFASRVCAALNELDQAGDDPKAELFKAVSLNLFVLKPLNY
jgi:hypothetical protein